MTPTPEACTHHELKWNISAQTSVMAVQTTVWGVECVVCGKKWDVGQVMQAIVDLAASQELVHELANALRRLVGRIDHNGGIGEYQGGPAFVMRDARIALCKAAPGEGGT